MSEIRYQTALATAVRDEMDADPDVCYLGEDVVHSLRAVSAGLAGRRADRQMAVVGPQSRVAELVAILEEAYAAAGGT
jgi:pyruvate/2-oxoglutarate/acetoin dehydrogenase E1 component